MYYGFLTYGTEMSLEKFETFSKNFNRCFVVVGCFLSISQFKSVAELGTIFARILALQIRHLPSYLILE